MSAKAKKVAPEPRALDALGYRTFEGPYQKPIPLSPPLAAPDPHYLERKKQVGENFFACKSGRKLCYFTDGAADPSAEAVAVVLCLHSCGLQKYMWL